MKGVFLSPVLAAALALAVLIGCGGEEDEQPATAVDLLIDRLRTEADAHVLAKGHVEQFFLSVSGRLLMVNASRVGVYEYPDAETAALEAARISPDGSTVGVSPEGAPVETELHYYGFPHFFLSDTLIAFYLGEGEGVLRPLELTMGPQFAGR